MRTQSASRVLLIVLDGVGVGELPDAALYGDAGSNTLAHTAEVAGGLRVPNLSAMGLGNILPLRGVPPVPVPTASFGRMAGMSKGKDSTTGHWELAGVVVHWKFPTYPHGFPQELLDRFREATGARGILGNIPASGTAIIQELGGEHLRTGYPIVYTSADSVFQIAAHEGVIALKALYDMCKRTREEVCVGPHAVGRVIARPFTGTLGRFARTTDRKDFSLEPPGETVLDYLVRAGIRTVGVGKIDDLFARRGLDAMYHTRTNEEGVDMIVRQSRELPDGLIMANLGDFDTLYGHRNDPEGFARAIEAFDARLPEITETLSRQDLLILTADHGNDPISVSTDHSREYVPLLVHFPGSGPGRNLGIRATFADVGKTIAEWFGAENRLAGTSFLSEIRAC